VLLSFLFKVLVVNGKRREKKQGNALNLFRLGASQNVVAVVMSHLMDMDFLYQLKLFPGKF